MARPLHLRSRIGAITDHAPGLRTLVLVPERPVPPFRPGQFMHLALDAYDPSGHWPDSRAFSIASPPSDRERIEITVSEVGRFTRRVMGLVGGEEVWVKLPYGEFTVECGDESGVVLVAGGTGITPFLSFLRQDRIGGAKVRLLYGARRPELLIFRRTLDEAERRLPGFGWQAFAEDGAQAPVRSGCLSAEAALEEAHRLPDPGGCDFYLSGPPAMISTLQSGLLAKGVAAGRIRVDAWG